MSGQWKVDCSNGAVTLRMPPGVALDLVTDAAGQVCQQEGPRSERHLDLLEMLGQVMWLVRGAVSPESVDLEAAESLLSVLRELKRVDVDNVAGRNNVYTLDNTGSGHELTTYAHVRAALMLPLVFLAGSSERAAELLDACHEGAETTVAHALKFMREKWAAQDAVDKPPW